MKYKREQKEIERGKTNTSFLHLSHSDPKTIQLKNMTYPPLNLPSVRQATSKPSPAPMTKLVGLSISGIPITERRKKEGGEINDLETVGRQR